jgi:DNA-binding NarL/FixJ family response regulator
VIRIVLADDQTLVRQGIRGLLALAKDIEVVGEAAGGEEAVKMIAELRPDVALLDVRMPGCSGIEVLRRCRAAGFAPPTILLTTFDDDAAFRAGIEAGIAGWLLKDVSLEELADAIREVAAGKSHVRPVAARSREAVRSNDLEFDAAVLPDPLTPREIEILRLIAAGMSNREIADTLGVAEGTVKNHTSSILSKLGVRDRTRAVLKALERGDL